MKTTVKKETYGGFNDAFAQFMAADGPVTLFYCRERDMCFTKTYPDLCSTIGGNSEYAGFEPLVSKKLLAAK